jgi:hypothetical protein
MCTNFESAQRFVSVSLETRSIERLNIDVLAGLHSISGGGSAVVHEHDPATRSWSRFDNRSERTPRSFCDADANVALLHLGRPLHEADLRASDFPFYRRLAANRGIMAFDKVPVFVDDRCVAALAVGRTETGELPESACAALSTIASAYARARTMLGAV